MKKISKKASAAILLCILASVFIVSVSAAGSDNSIINILNSIIDALNGIQSTVDKGAQVVTYSGYFVLETGTPATMESAYIEEVWVDRDKAADFKLTLSVNPQEAPWEDFTTTSGDNLIIAFGWGAVSQGIIRLFDEDITNEPVERSFTGQEMRIHFRLAATLERPVIINYSYTVTTSADAVVTQTHYSPP